MHSPLNHVLPHKYSTVLVQSAPTPVRLLISSPPSPPPTLTAFSSPHSHLTHLNSTDNMPTPGSFATVVYAQWFLTPKLDPKLSFAGQTVIVTGANVGLGFHAAQQIAQRGASKVILAVRSLSKGEAAAQEIRATLPKSSTSSTLIEVWPLDLSSYQSVQDFAARAIKELGRLDVLLESAGVAKLKFELEEGDDESVIKTNVLSTTLLALLLISKLKETATRFGVTPRLSIVSSELAFHAKFNEAKAERIFGRNGGLADPKADMMDR